MKVNLGVERGVNGGGDEGRKIRKGSFEGGDMGVHGSEMG